MSVHDCWIHGLVVEGMFCTGRRSKESSRRWTLERTEGSAMEQSLVDRRDLHRGRMDVQGSSGRWWMAGSLGKWPSLAGVLVHNKLIIILRS